MLTLPRPDVQSTGQNILLYEELRTVLDAFRRENIKVIVLKGAALAETVYPHIGWRPLSDVDLLVKEEGLTRAQTKLAGLGYQIQSGSRLFYQKKSRPWAAVDLHTNLDHLPPQDIPRLWAESRTVKIAGIETLVMSTEDTLIHLVSHLAVSHGFPLAKWLTDIDVLVRGYVRVINWETVIQRARICHLAIPLFYTLSQVRDYFRTPIPGEILAELKPGKRNFFSSAIFKLVLASKKPLPFIDYLLPVLVRPGLKNKVKFICSVCFPSPEFISRRYQNKSRLPIAFYYLLRPISLLLKGLLAIEWLIIHILREKTKKFPFSYDTVC